MNMEMSTKAVAFKSKPQSRRSIANESYLHELLAHFEHHTELMSSSRCIYLMSVELRKVEEAVDANFSLDFRSISCVIEMYDVLIVDFVLSARAVVFFLVSFISTKTRVITQSMSLNRRAASM